MLYIFQGFRENIVKKLMKYKGSPHFCKICHRHFDWSSLSLAYAQTKWLK